MKNIKDAPQRIKDGIKAWEEMGGKLIGFYSTMGEYDYVAISEAPDDETVAAYSFSLGRLGNVKTTTLKAFTVDEFSNIVAKIP
jgi:uncharacterized protein with GYD domain